MVNIRYTYICCGVGFFGVFVVVAVLFCCYWVGCVCVLVFVCFCLFVCLFCFYWVFDCFVIVFVCLFSCYCVVVLFVFLKKKNK